jgi:N-carbamoyl-L-amino-acid hydrolase
MISNLDVDGARLWSSLMASAEIGRTPNGGLRRLTLTDEDRQMRDLFARWAGEAGFSVTVDHLGNMFVRRAGRDPALPPVLIGSHLDSQAKGGRFDGVLGVMAGLEILRTLTQAQLATRRTIEVVNWTNEEGARFSPPMMCSLVFADQESVAWAHGRVDRAGIRFGDALENIGYAGPAPVGGRAVDSYFELHIEQGPKLDAEGIPVGIVTGGFAMRGIRIAVQGETSHVGPTPMHLRRNALVGAAHAAIAIDEIGWRYAIEGGKTTAARLEVFPNLPGIISDEAVLYADFRHPDVSRLADMERDVEAAIGEAGRRSNTRVTIAERWGFGGLEFDKALVSLLRDSAQKLGIAAVEMRSEAGHDAYNMAKICPAAMIFTPCRGGISHNEREDIDLAATLPGVNLLLHAVLAQAEL